MARWWALVRVGVRYGNCGSGSARVFDVFSGKALARADPHTLSIPEIEAFTGVPQVRMSPAEIEKALVDGGPGSYAVIGIDRPAPRAGHWFNEVYDGNSVRTVDGQNGYVGG